MQMRLRRITGGAYRCNCLTGSQLVADLHRHAARLQMRVELKFAVAMIDDDMVAEYRRHASGQ